MMETIEKLEHQIAAQQRLREHLLGTVNATEFNLAEMDARRLELLRDNDEPRPDYRHLVSGVVYDTGPIADPRILAHGRAL